jgi:transposase
MIESMDTSQPPDGISPEDWAKTPMSVQQLVYGLRLTLQSLEKRVADLEEQLGKNSSNSSKPPSSDPPGQTKAPRQPSGRKAGGQPGHVGQSRKR